MMVIYCDTASDIEYIKYLDNHISNVNKSFDMVKSDLMHDAEVSKIISKIESNIRAHDESKRSVEEWEPYRNYFYPTEDHPKDEKAFDLAWLHHQKNNPHHWQYWVLIRDSGETIPQDIPLCYIIEALCDWHSFSANNPESTAFTWYQKNKSKMVLSENSKQLFDTYVEYFKEPIQGGVY